MKTPEEMAEEYRKSLTQYTGGWEQTLDMGFLAGYKAAETNFSTLGKWISVMSKTPPIENDGDDSIKVLTINKHKEIDVLTWDWMDWENLEVTHWMPLPEAPKENE